MLVIYMIVISDSYVWMISSRRNGIGRVWTIGKKLEIGECILELQGIEFALGIKLMLASSTYCLWDLHSVLFLSAFISSSV